MFVQTPLKRLKAMLQHLNLETALYRNININLNPCSLGNWVLHNAFNKYHLNLN